MSLMIYFDNQLIDEQYYIGLSETDEMFGDTYKLGATSFNTFVLSVAKEGVITQPTEVKLANNVNDYFAYLKVDNIEEKEYEYVYTLSDKMADLEFFYDASDIFVDGKTTLLAIVQDICAKVGLTLQTTNFRGYDKEISWYDNTKTARQYISYVAELNGGHAWVRNDVLYFTKQKPTLILHTINLENCEEYTIGEKHKITRVVYEMGAVKWEYGDDTGNTLYLNNENAFITEQSEVQAIYNDIKDFEFYSVDIKNVSPINRTLRAGTVYRIRDGNNYYPSILQYNLEYVGEWVGNYSLNVNTKRQEETQIIPTKDHIKNLQITVNRHEGEIESKVQKDEVISTINQSAEAVSINANKIDLNGVVTANQKFKILSDGSMEARDGKFIGGNITLEHTGGLQAFRIIKNNNTDTMLYATEDTMGINNNDDHVECYCDSDVGPRVDVYRQGASGTYISYDGIRTPTLTQTSLENEKKNFEKLQEGLNIIKNTDIYKYNMKSEEDGTKKHIGFVIGKNYKYAHEITAENEKKEEVGVDTYSMISVAYKAIQELYNDVEELKKKYQN